MKFERNQEILELFKKGYSCSQLGEMYNVSKQRISDIVKRQQARNQYYSDCSINENKIKEMISEFMSNKGE